MDIMKRKKVKKYILIGGTLLALLLIFLSVGGSITSTITGESNSDLSGEGSIVSTSTDGINDDSSIYAVSSEFY